MMMDDKGEKYWANVASVMLKAELTKQQIGYSELVDKLAEFRFTITADQLSNLIDQGTFSAKFLIICLKAIGVTNFSLDNDYWGPYQTG